MITKKLNEMKEDADMTNQEIADSSGVPLSTINRIMAGQTDNPSFQTIAAIVKALGGSLDELAGIECKHHADDHHVSNKLIDIYKEQIGTKNRWIRTLFLCLVAVISCIIFILLWDITHPHVGWVQY